MSHVHSWAVQHAQPHLVRVSAQLYGLVIDFLKADVSPYLPSILEDMNAILHRSALLLDSAATSDTSNSGEDAVDALSQQWQTPYHTLLAISKALREKPEFTTQDDVVDWASVVTLLLFPHAWVRTASCRLLGTLFAAVPAGQPSTDDSLFSQESLEEIATKLTLQLKSEHLDEQLSLQIVKNLFYVGKRFCAVDSTFEDDSSSEDDDDQSAGDEPSTRSERHPLSKLFSKMSFQARSALIRRRSKAKSPVCGIRKSRSV